MDVQVTCHSSQLVSNIWKLAYLVAAATCKYFVCSFKYSGVLTTGSLCYLELESTCKRTFIHVFLSQILVDKITKVP